VSAAVGASIVAIASLSSDDPRLTSDERLAFGLLMAIGYGVAGLICALRFELWHTALSGAVIGAVFAAALMYNDRDSAGEPNRVREWIILAAAYGSGWGVLAFSVVAGLWSMIRKSSSGAK
jgi:hypothetical protein